MFGKKKTKGTFEVDDNRPTGDGHSFIASNVYVEGSIIFSGTLRVDGRISGKITSCDANSGTVILSKGAIIRGPITAHDIISDGRIEGNIKLTNRLELRSNAVVHGDVGYKSIHIAEGAFIDGRCTQLTRKSQDDKSQPLSLATRNVTYLRKA